MFLFGHAEFELPVGQTSPSWGYPTGCQMYGVYSQQTSGGYKSDCSHLSHLFVIQCLLI